MSPLLALVGAETNARSTSILLKVAGFRPVAIVSFTADTCPFRGAAVRPDRDANFARSVSFCARGFGMCKARDAGREGKKTGHCQCGSREIVVLAHGTSDSVTHQRHLSSSMQFHACLPTELPN